MEAAASRVTPEPSYLTALDYGCTVIMESLGITPYVQQTVDALHVLLLLYRTRSLWLYCMGGLVATASGD